ncbi:hypothetical protein HELRODRAFT_192081 [Helobdella robusta]|uniref:Uncharacterized protein n=1 Tax=Helobdella robusta TaxID=6412 RepID=T1FTK3_HELRO|nr:hypothetical protein HELRODRAFT_192081 [Helobdella robusta]ESO03019.1 hypothetical protein HELRODRAFT_192081 [Helobdella robusta]
MADMIACATCVAVHLTLHKRLDFTSQARTTSSTSWLVSTFNPSMSSIRGDELIFQQQMWALKLCAKGLRVVSRHQNLIISLPSINVEHIDASFYQHSRALYNALQLNKMDMYIMRDGAKKLEEDMNEKNKRTKIIEELGNVWVEYRHDDDSTSCINNLKGHQLNGRYDEPLPPINSQKYEEQHCNSVDQLTKDVEHLFILSNDLPPNYHLKNFNRSLFLDLLGRMTIKSNADADLCLRLANSLTLSLLKYRMRSINNLKTINADELKGKIEGLIDDATSVSEKLLQKRISFT